MTLEDFKKKELPDVPGVYFFKNALDEILYIGKATSLKDRVRSYFAPDLFQTRGRLILDMVALAADVEVTETDSVLEALILEANLIKKHQPKYNTKEKDNKSYNYVVITNEDFPKVLTIRGRTLLISSRSAYKYIFGPFPHGAELREAMKIIRRIFPYSDDKCKPGRPCFNRQIGLCPGVCTGEISQEDYKNQINHLKLFFEGKKKTLLKNLEKEMREFAEKKEFEKAAEIRKTIFALTHIQDVALLKSKSRLDESSGGEYGDRGGVFRIEAYDVAHSSGKHVVGVMTVIEDGEIKKSDYRKFRIKLNPGVNDTAALKEMLRRRLGHLEWRLPNIIAVDGAQAQINVAENAVKERGLKIDVVAVVKDERHKPREVLGDSKLAKAHGRTILLANAEAHRFAVAYHRQKRDRLI